MKLILPILMLALSVHAQSIQEQLLKGEPALDTSPIEVEKITYDIVGDAGKPWMVLVHGLGGSRDAWQPVAQNLSRDFRLLIVDQRGHGDNPIEGDNYTSSTMASDIAKLMEHLNIEKAHMVGHSMGGRTVMRFASSYPDKTLSVIVEDMHAIGRTKLLTDFTDLSHKIKPLYKPVYPSPEAFYAAYQPFMNWKDPKHIFFFGHRTGNGNFVLNFRPHVNLLYSNQGLQEDLTKALISIKTPITFFAAGREDDAVLFGKGVDHIKQNKPDAKIVVFEGAGHSIHWDSPGQFVDEVRKATGLDPKRKSFELTKEILCRKLL